MLVNKRLFAGILALFSFSLTMAAPPAVHPETGTPLVITCFRGTPAAIDGDLSDWSLEAMTPAIVDSPRQVYTGQTSWTGPEDCSGKFYVMWDDTKVYLAAVVKDDRLSMSKSGGDIWNADCAEMFFSTTNAVAGHAEHFQWGFNANNQKWRWESMDGGGSGSPTELEVVSSRTPDGYICEVALDYTGIRALQIEAGNTIGFHVCLDDTEATDREVQITWIGREAHDQSLGFGNLVFSSEPAVAKELARNPSPAHKAADVPVDTSLSWDPGQFAASHDVYFGTAFEDVNSASRANPKSVLAGQGQAATEFQPAALDYGQTYYWRVDEVSAAPDNTIYTGQVWSFTTEPYAYPITAVTATASSFQPGMGPQNTVNGSGLDADDQHSTESTQMWLSTGVKPHWIQYAFDKVYKVDSLWVWNSNQMIEGFVGFGAKNVTIEYSTDGATWTALAGAPEFARAPGAATYKANTVVDFGGVTAKFVKLTVNTNWGGVAPQTSLSEVRFFYVPVQAFSPTPGSAATEISLNAALTWRSGREATSHKVYFGADSDAVAAGTAAGQTVADASFTPAAMNFGTKYFWKVDEIGDGGTYEGDLWSFTTQEFAPIDDFEAYNDDDNRIYSAWLDGVATKASGSTVGYFQAPFAEKVIIHSGKQAMPFEYNNTAAPFFSEAEQEFATAQNWSVNGADTLSLWVRGNPAGYVDNGGTVTMTAAGHDIWDNADDFRFAFKTLTGDGSILVKVESLVNTNNWAKAGVMIRQDLTDSSKFAYFVQSFNQGVSLGWRQMTSGTCGSATQAAIAAPQWVKLIRKGDVFTAQYSADGKTWTDLKNADGTVASTTVAMTNPVHIGLCVTSHNTTATTTAVMSGAATTGTVSGSWQVQAIGDDPQLANDPADLYVTVQDSAGKKATATHATAVNAGVWTQWQIPLSSFTGVNLKSVKKLILGVDSRTSPTKGAGMLFIDDIGFGHPAQ